MSSHLDDHRYGASFDVTLYCSVALENGKTAGEGAQFVPLVAQAIEAYIGAGLGREMPAAANNTFRALGTVNENGEPNILGSPGLLRAVFDGPGVARVHAAGHGAGQILARWAALDDAASAQSSEETAAQVHHLGNDYSFMTHGQVDDDGVSVLADFDKELEKNWKRRKPAAARWYRAFCRPRRSTAYECRPPSSTAPNALRVRCWGTPRPRRVTPGP